MASVVAADYSANRQQHEPEDQVRDRVRDHGSALQLEWLAHGDEGRRPAAVVDNVPVLRGTERGHVFRAGKTPFHPVRRVDRAPHSRDQRHRSNDREDPRRAALGAACGLGGCGPCQFATGPADRAVAVRSMRSSQVRTDQVHGSSTYPQSVQTKELSSALLSEQGVQRVVSDHLPYYLIDELVALAPAMPYEATNPLAPSLPGMRVEVCDFNHTKRLTHRRNPLGRRSTCPGRGRGGFCGG